ncbi:MAG: alpha/beta hydrolase [Alphaproteobacteria bacterium CG11_big_fil_rev_8_21_14_0_20_44_7]|nr:MAG: alpha/beta hydrolase [Alphaproteobacteria bacterium CG11_big_fil_rev_8_21_14_0_20_44_7]
MGGFRSDMSGAKALYLEELCKATGNSFIRFDYSGHGESDGEFEKCTIGKWKKDALQIIEELTNDEIIIIGSSMGGWIGLLAALEVKKRVKGFIGIAAAPDFTEDLIWNEFDEFTQKKLERDGLVLMPNCYDDQEPYPITQELIEEGRKHLLLRGEIKLNCPIRLLQGMDDEDVPYETAGSIAECLTSKDVEVHLIKNASHRFSEPENLELLKNTLLELLK